MVMDFARLAWAELRETKERLGGSKGLLAFLGMIAFLGVAVPYWLGFGFLDPHLLSSYACLSPLFINKLVAGAVAERPTRVWPVVVAGTAVGWLAVFAAGALGLISVNAMQDFGGLILPPAGFLAGMAGLALAAAFLSACAAAAIALRSPGPGEGEHRARLITVFLFGGVLVGWPYLPEALRAAVDSQLVPERAPWIALAAAAVAVLGGAALSLLVRRQPRYSGLSLAK